MPTANRTERTSILAPTALVGAALLLSSLGTTTAAAADDPAELTEQALRYLHAEGVERDPDRAVRYLCTAARKGHGVAAYELGWAYLNGRGVPRDDALAAAWLREAARLGEKTAERPLARLASVEQKPLRCVGADGLPLRPSDARRADLVAAIRRLAPEYGLDPALVLEVVRAESNFDPLARSPKGALGLMQLIPETAARFGVNDPFEPGQNLRGGMAYLRWLLARFEGNLALTLAGYNAGERAVERYGGVPPYSETQAYVERILTSYGRYRTGETVSASEG